MFHSVAGCQIPSIHIVPPPEQNTEYELPESPKSINRIEDNINSDEDSKASKKPTDDAIAKERCWEIINSISNRTCLPPAIKDVPMHLAMTSLLISTSGFISKKISEAVGDKINRMNGTLTPNYTAITTHIVATHGLTEKVTLARKRKLPVMTLEWVNTVWKACQTNPYVHAAKPEFQKYTCPLFHNVKFHISKEIHKDNRIILKSLITKHGGKVMDKVAKDQTDILICKTSQELCFKRAMQLGIPIVSAAWVTVSILDTVIHDFVGYKIPHLNKGQHYHTSFRRTEIHTTARSRDSWAPGTNSTDVCDPQEDLARFGSNSMTMLRSPPTVSKFLEFPIPSTSSLSPLRSCYFEVSSADELRKDSKKN